MLLYIIRHGETRLNLEGRLQGWVDEPLNQSGLDLAKVTGEALKDIPFDKVYASPLCRASVTGELAVAPAEEVMGKKVPFIKDDRLKEFNWGSWDCMRITKDAMEVPDPEDYYRLLGDPLNFIGADDGERVMDVIERTGDFYKELIEDPENQDKTILIATHGGAGRALLCHVYGDNTDFWRGGVPQNCAVNIVEVKDGKATVIEKDKLYYDPELAIDPYTLD